MKINLSDLTEVYNQIRQDSLDKGCSVLIYVSGDVDAICACKIFTTLLHKDAVQYCVTPVANYSELQESLNGISDPNLHTIVLFNLLPSLALNWRVVKNIIYQSRIPLLAN